MRGEMSSAAPAKRHPLDWYVEEEWVTHQLYTALGQFAREKRQGLTIWDPCAGYGHTGVIFHHDGFRVVLGDLVNNVDWLNYETSPNRPLPPFIGGDFLQVERAPAPCTIVFNPPYSYLKVQGVLISELFIRHAISLAKGRVCALLPTKWLSSQSRYQLFMHDHPPQAVLHLSQRPSMPPGDRIQAMGSRAYRGGMVDYCWIVWDVAEPTPPGETLTIWLPPLERAGETLLVERLA